MKQERSSLLFSLLFSMNTCEEHEVTLEDLRYLHCPDVSSCQIKMYSLVIECLCSGMSYDEINSFIDKINIDEYKKLNEEAQVYVRAKVKKDLDDRKNNELKRRRDK